MAHDSEKPAGYYATIGQYYIADRNGVKQVSLDRGRLLEILKDHAQSRGWSTIYEQQTVETF
jgi:hypothetical protein